jgi:uncharacterized repeat protein (TIGR01451 family)
MTTNHANGKHAVRMALLVMCVLAAIGGGEVGVARASGGAVWWSVTSGARPTVLVPGHVGEVIVWTQNLGDVETSSAVSVQDELPSGLTAIGISATAGGTGSGARGPVKCSLAKLSCAYGAFEENSKHEIVEDPAKEVIESLPPYEFIEVRIIVQVSANATSGQNQAAVSGGGATTVVRQGDEIRVGETPAAFGFEQYSLIPENEGGSIDTQAGSHPFQLATTITFNNEGLDSEKNPQAIGLPRNIADELAPGMIGNPTPFAQCTDAQFAAQPEVENGVEVITNECPAASAIGVATAEFTDPEGQYTIATAPVFNVTPLAGEPARFGFKAGGVVSAFLDVSVRTGGDYGVTVTSENITQLASVLSVRLTIWGVPGDKRHDQSRGWECMYHFGSCPATVTNHPPPFLVMPTSCETGMASTISAVSWPAEGKPGTNAEPLTYEPAERLDGCDRLPFAPEIKVTPDGTDASSPTGLNVDVHVPQTAILDASSLAESAVKGISVTLPEGVAINPAGGDGLQACTEGEIGYQAEASQVPTNLRFTPDVGQPFCPDASKVGTVKIKLPILENPVEGAVYIAAQNENPFGSLLALYIVAEDPVSGVLVKLAGQTTLSATGQITGTFEGSPQAPFEDAELHFFGGERAPLATPAHCGQYTTDAVFSPWSGTEPVKTSSTFAIDTGPNGAPCPGSPLPFTPSFTGGTLNIQAGAFSALTTTIGREDGQQNIESVQVHMPSGLSGLLAGVKLCPEQEADAGTCPPESLIGETTVSAGVGSDPVTVKGGKVYITEKYDGAPFGLSIVNPVKAGPFDLEHDTANASQTPACDCLVVRATIQIDPHTAVLTVTTNDIPRYIDGIPVELKRVNVTINRPGFSFNPTNCSHMAISGEVKGDEGVSSPIAVPFQAANCATLGFKPTFTAETTNKTSRADGASLAVHLTYPNAPFGTQANIAYTKVELPKQLPSRLGTLQKACLASQFDANPAGCPPASLVGTARAITPLLPVPLEGPAYFVSFGSAKYPDLVIVLQGYGVTVDLVGETAINTKTGVTSSTFPSIPDAPVSSFELNLPTGPYSALGTIYNLCTQTLAMPTIFKAQNGAELTQSTPIVVQGCKALTVLSEHKMKSKLKFAVKTTEGGTLVITSNNSRRYTRRVGDGNYSIVVPLRHANRSTSFKLQLHGARGTATATVKVR